MQTSGPLAVIGTKVVSGTKAKLTTSTSPMLNGVSIKSFAANTNKIYVGDGDVTVGGGYELSPGQEHLFRVQDASTLWVVGTDGTVCFEGT